MGGKAAPHGPLLDYYAAPQDRLRFVRELFDRTATSYDRINDGLALGSGAGTAAARWSQAGLRPGMRLLDVAVGTGAVAREARKITPDVIGLDLSAGMLKVARANLPELKLIQSEGEALPLGDASVDMVSMGYALRHVGDLGALFAEFAACCGRAGGCCCWRSPGRRGTWRMPWPASGWAAWCRRSAGCSAPSPAR
jgi:demethylmenaquinone methyltransferase/2-methoxy-6-polyprenyl-1,4-benzoquinol methylase